MKIFYILEQTGNEGIKNLNAHNLIGGLLEDLCVCEGYSKILVQVLKCLNIDAIYISGKPIDKHDNIPHAWNQVKIDETWYNADLTWDADKIKDGSTPIYCLQSDIEFMHDYIPKDAHIINNSYPQNILDNYFSGRSFHINCDESFSSEKLAQLIQELKQNENYKSDGFSLNILNTIPGYCVAIDILNIFDGKNFHSIYDKTLITLDYEELFKFINEYINSNNLSKAKIGTDSTTILSRNDNINFIFESSLKESLLSAGIDIDSIISPVHELTANTLMRLVQDLRTTNEDSEINITIRR